MSAIPTAVYDEDTDILYVEFRESLVAKTIGLGWWRNIDLAADGSVLGVEFINASAGIDLDGVPQREEIAAAIERLGSLRILPAARTG